MPHRTWQEKIAEVRRRDRERRRKAAARTSITGDLFDITRQLAGVTDDWAPTKKRKR